MAQPVILATSLVVFTNAPGGPVVSGDTSASGYGWSADLHSAVANHTMVTTGGATTQGDMMCAWFYFQGRTQRDHHTHPSRQSE